MKFQLFLWVIVALAFSCKKQTITNAPNKFSDSVLVSIHEYKDQRATDQLLNFLNSENTTYQSEAALALASVGSNTATPKLIDAFVAINSLTPENVLTQKNLGYAIYQSAEQLNKSDFLKLYQASVNSQVLQYVLWTLGKSSDFKNDSLLWFGFDKNQNEAHYKKGMIKGFYEFCSRKHWSLKMITTALKFCQPNENREQRILAAAYLARLVRLHDSTLTNAFASNTHNISADLIHLLKNEPDPLVKMNLSLATKLFSNHNKPEFIKKQLKIENDYRVKVALIQALNSTNYQKTKASISQLIGHKNHHLEIAAAKYFANFSTNSDLILIDSLYRKCSHWQAANQMVLAQLKHLNKSSVANSLVLKSVDKAPNKWAKGELYGIMGQNHGLLDSLINLYFTETDATAKTLCLESVCRATENFEDEILAAPKGSQKMTHLIKIATDALSANDGYRVYTAAMHLQQKAFKMAGNAKMVQKLDSLLKKWPIPLYYETHLELAKLKQLCKVGQINLKTLPIAYNNPTDWQFAKSIKKNQLLNISTQKGDILIQLDVENAPSTVAYICKLANDGFYDNLIWHRVVSNFVIQGGDPFGNGTGSAKGTLRSEHSLNEYTEGAMGIASAGKDTESCQFFITHNYTPHLNGRYTIIGYVLNGIDVVHKIDVNDKTLSVKLID